MAEWYTRTFEGRVERSVRVQVPPTTFKKRVTFVTLFLICLNGEGFNPFIAGSADLRTDGVKRVRIARKLSGVEPQVQKRNFPSVEQIQDKSRLRHHKKRGFKPRFLFYFSV